MASGGVDLDELLAARARMNAERDRASPKGGTTAGAADEDLTLFRLIGLWLVVTGLIIVRVAVVILMAMAAGLEWLQHENSVRRSRRRRR